MNTRKERAAKTKQAIDLLNEIAKIRLQASAIHGVGVFALRDFKKGEKLYADAVFHQFDIPYSKFKELRPEVREIILGQWPQVVNGSHFIYPTTKMTAYLNHADKPNYDAKSDKMLRAVKAGTEITEDYRLIDGWEKIYPWLA